MDPAADILAGSIPIEREPDDTGLESPQFRDDIQSMMTLPPENASSFTALLELPATQAMELLHSMGSDGPQMTATLSGEAHHHPINDEHKPYFHSLVSKLTFPSNTALIESAARFSVFAGVHSPETTISVPLNSSANSEKVKNEPTAETDSNLNASQAIASDPTVEITNQKSTKRKEREKKGKASTKKSKNENSEEAEKLPYVHVRARRGQATDSHSLAERARREKINARMKQLQELVPGCNKILGTALVLDEIINHVQSLQSQVEFLSMRLAAVKPRVDFNLDSILATEDGSLMDSNYPGVVVPAMWAQDRQQYQQQQQQWNLDALHQPAWEGREAESHNFITPDTSFLSYDCSANSASLHTHHLKMEL